MATHSSILAWKIPGTEEPGGLQSTGHKEPGTTFAFSDSQQCVSLRCTILLWDDSLMDSSFKFYN